MFLVILEKGERGERMGGGGSGTKTSSDPELGYRTLS